MFPEFDEVELKDKFSLEEKKAVVDVVNNFESITQTGIIEFLDLDDNTAQVYRQFLYDKILNYVKNNFSSLYPPRVEFWELLDISLPYMGNKIKCNIQN